MLPAWYAGRYNLTANRFLVIVFIVFYDHAKIFICANTDKKNSVS